MTIEDLFAETAEALGDGQTRFLVTFTNGQQYRFWAEDAAHALEQAEDAEPNLAVESVKPA
jgi:hypothetical protein